MDDVAEIARGLSQDEVAAGAAERAGRLVECGDGDTYISGSALDAAQAIRARFAELMKERG